MGLDPVDHQGLYGFISAFVISRLICAAQILREEKSAVSRVCRMISDFFHKMSLLNSCFSRAETFSVELQESCIESGIALLNFLTYLINFMRNDLPVESAAGKTP